MAVNDLMASTREKNAHMRCQFGSPPIPAGENEVCLNRGEIAKEIKGTETEKNRF